MPKIALYGSFNEDIRNILFKTVPDGFELIDIPDPERTDFLADAEYMINRVHYVPETVLEAAPKLRFIAKWGVGVEKLDIEAAGKRGIPIVPCIGINSAPVSELAVLLMLSVSRHLLEVHNELLGGNWKARDEYARRSYMIKNKKVGLLGCGNIGRRVANIVKNGFGATVQYYDVFRMPEEQEKKLGIEYVGLDTLYQTSDIISLHLPLLDSTHNMVGTKQFDMMKKNAIIINTSRGGIIDEAALYAALTKGKIAGAGLDTYAQEPVSPDNALLKLPNVVATPHFGGNTADNDINMIRRCYDNIVKFENGAVIPEREIANYKFLKK